MIKAILDVNSFIGVNYCSIDRLHFSHLLHIPDSDLELTYLMVVVKVSFQDDLSKMSGLAPSFTLTKVCRFSSYSSILLNALMEASPSYYCLSC